MREAVARIVRTAHIRPFATGGPSRKNVAFLDQRAIVFYRVLRYLATHSLTWENAVDPAFQSDYSRPSARVTTISSVPLSAPLKAAEARRTVDSDRLTYLEYALTFLLGGLKFVQELRDQPS